MVCPPPNTHTDLNLILMEADKIELTESMRTELRQKVYELLQDYLFGKLEGIMNLFQEDRRYVNWFNGNRRVALPKKTNYDSETWSYKILTASDLSVSIEYGENLVLEVMVELCQKLPKMFLSHQ